MKSLREYVQQQSFVKNNNDIVFDRFIYIWLAYVDNEVLPIYVGRGKHSNKRKYNRAYEFHKISKNGKATYAQNKILSLKRIGIYHHTYILYDEINLDEANYIEQLLINMIGRRVNNTGPLCNLSQGGEINPMEDSLIREKHLIIVKSEEHSDNLKRNYNRSSEVVERRTIASRLRLKDPEVILKNSIRRNNIEYRKLQRIVQSKLTGRQVTFKGKTYNSIREASNDTGINRGTIKNRMAHSADISKNRQLIKVKYMGETYESKKLLASHLQVTIPKLRYMMKKCPHLFEICDT